MIIDEKTEITKNAERYAARRYSAHAAEQRRYLEAAYNAASTRDEIAASKRQASSVTCETSIPALDYLKRAARLYVSPMTSAALAELDDVSRVIVITGLKTIIGVGVLLSFVALVFG